MPEETAQQQVTPNTQVRLALERTRLANDRTMMAWIRTATSLISFGFGVYKFFQLELRVAGRENQRIGVREFALLMVGPGVLAMVLGTLDHWYRGSGNVCSDLSKVDWASEVECQELT
jgi:uncharacterized membrane protein YidH (DUF202 family)